MNEARKYEVVAELEEVWGQGLQSLKLTLAIAYNLGYKDGYRDGAETYKRASYSPSTGDMGQ